MRVPANQVLCDEADLMHQCSSTACHLEQSHPSFAWVASVINLVEPNEADVFLIGMTPVEELIMLVDRLLGPNGCPWDQQQTHASLSKHLIEESYEFVEALEAGNPAELAEELGDVLLQPVMHGQLSQRNGAFGTQMAAQAVVDKLIFRHPHVFGEVVAETTEEVLRNWDKLKKTGSVLGSLPKSMPSLMRAMEVSKRAARHGFEWPNIEGVFEKLREETNELREALASAHAENIEAEVGDMLFTVVNLARWAKVEPEAALRRMIDRFSERFSKMEERATKDLGDLSPQEWEDLWQHSKQH